MIFRGYAAAPGRHRAGPEPGHGALRGAPRAAPGGGHGGGWGRLPEIYGKLLRNPWGNLKSIGKPMENLVKTSGKPFENLVKNRCEKAAENVWKTV